MEPISFVANELIVKNNKTLKMREQGSVELEFERGPYLQLLLALELYPSNTHFRVAITPIDENS